MSHSAEIFKQILDEKHLSPIAVFDLDSTLYNVSHRTQKIIEDFADEALSIKKHIDQLDSLKQVKVLMADWGLKEPLLRAGLNPSPELFRDLSHYWHRTFFSSEYLIYDIPYEGAVHYVNGLASEGIKIMYLTGRDAPNMFDGTVKSLKQWNLPLVHEKDLIMKDAKGLVEDEDYKTSEMAHIKLKNKKIWFFENEPVIVNKVINSHPDVCTVWVNTTHSGRAKPPNGLPVIGHVWQK